MDKLNKKIFTNITDLLLDYVKPDQFYDIELIIYDFYE